MRPAHIWWIGAFLFGLSVLIWSWVLGITIYKGDFGCPFDAHGITYVYLPLAAAVVGLIAPLICIWRFWRASLRANALAFTVYFVTMTVWGVIDIRYSHCQVFFCPVTADFSGRSQVYFTWWFLPQQLIPRVTTHR